MPLFFSAYECVMPVAGEPCVMRRCRPDRNWKCDKVNERAAGNGNDTADRRVTLAPIRLSNIN